jgi:hypothetical protein
VIKNCLQAWGVEIGPDGTLFLANGSDGLRAYTFDGATFTNTAHIVEGGFRANEVALSPEGMVFVAYGINGLCAYSYNGSSFTRSGKIDNGGSAHDVFVGTDGTIFLANEDDGFRSYVYDGTSFTNIGHIPDIGYAYGVTAREDSLVYIASTSTGLHVYEYSGYVGVKNKYLPHKYELFHNYPNPFNPVTTIGYELPESQNITLQIFDITGRLVETLYSGYKEAGHWDATWDASDQSSGIYIYRLQVGDEHISRKMLLLK